MLTKLMKAKPGMVLVLTLHFLSWLKNVLKYKNFVTTFCIILIQIIPENYHVFWFFGIFTLLVTSTGFSKETYCMMVMMMMMATQTTKTTVKATMKKTTDDHGKHEQNKDTRKKTIFYCNNNVIICTHWRDKGLPYAGFFLVVFHTC